jgi:hypothetical protein
MTRFQNLLLATILMTNTSAFAADTPDPNSKGEAALPSGSNAATPPSTPPAGTATGSNAGQQPPATSPGEENKGKPKTPDQ